MILPPAPACSQAFFRFALLVLFRKVFAHPLLPW
jgi:hypothetical protein